MPPRDAENSFAFPHVLQTGNRLTPLAQLMSQPFSLFRKRFIVAFCLKSPRGKASPTFRWGKKRRIHQIPSVVNNNRADVNYSCNLRDRRLLPITPRDRRSPVPKVTTAVCTFA
ncbi:hypothetical protein TNCV_461681, partial [Trichonephila clavipes]